MADGEEKPVKLQAGRRILTLWASYLEGNLDFRNDPNPHRSDFLKRFAFEPEWGRGKIYRHINLGKKSTSEVSNASILVQVVVPTGKKHNR